MPKVITQYTNSAQYRTLPAFLDIIYGIYTDYSRPHRHFDRNPDEIADAVEKSVFVRVALFNRGADFSTSLEMTEGWLWCA